VNQGSVNPRRTSFSSALTPLRRGNTFGDGRALRGIDDAAAIHLRAKDPVAARALRRLVSSRTLKRNVTEWCLWLEEHSESDIGQSHFLTERVYRVQKHRKSAVAPWRYERLRQPRPGAFVVVARFPRRWPRVVTFQLSVDAVIDASVASVDDPVTAGVIMSRPYRVWIDVVSPQHSETVTVSSTGVHNTFPCPDLTDDDLDAIEDAVQRVLMAIRYAVTDSVIELYERDTLPDALQQAHDHLDAVVCDALGIDATCSDSEIARQLTEMYQSLVTVG
jgi:hypothetical protein